MKTQTKRTLGFAVIVAALAVVYPFVLHVPNLLAADIYRDGEVVAQTLEGRTPASLNPPTAAQDPITGFIVTKREPLVTMEPDGNYKRTFGTKTNVLKLTTTEIILECSRQDGNPWVIYGYDSPWEYWREYYEVKDSRIYLVKTVSAKVTPQQDAAVVWPEEAK